MLIRTNAKWLCALAMAGLLSIGAAAYGKQAGLPDEDRNPESGSGYTQKSEVHAKHFMVATANPHATRAGYEMLRQGGGALDAIIAAQMVLTLVEPQSSGIGGGAFAVYYDMAHKTLTAYDGRETAPAAAMPGRFMADGKPLPYRAAVNSGLAVGVPGVLRALEMAHKQHGKLPWAALFQPAIRLAEEGFRVSPRMHAMLRNSPELARQQAAAAYFFDPAGQPWPVGHLLKNPDLAKVLRQVAQQGADAFYRGDIAGDIVAAVRGHPTPGDMTLADLANYRALQREPLCGNYRLYRICGMPPPSSGTLGVLELLGVLQHVPMETFKPAGLRAVHYFSEAGRLAYADRDYYVADPDFVDVPVQALISPAYLASRFALIRPDRSMGTAAPGDPMGMLRSLGRDNALEIPSTSHLVAVDAAGDVVSMTTSIEAAFGSKIFVRGFLLNNQLTDFSRDPVDAEGRPVANRVQPGKRPRSTMAPIIVFRDNEPYMALGSPGGNVIINYVAKTLVAVLDWNMSVQDAISLPNFGSRNKRTELEKSTALAVLAKPLEAMGHDVVIQEFPSGVQAIVIDRSGLSAGADPRREGVAMGG
ncbi:gamma-glutamyltransferase [Eoetvoesiella caeni]